MIELKVEKQSSNSWFWSLKVNGLWKVYLKTANSLTQAAEDAEKWIAENGI